MIEKINFFNNIPFFRSRKQVTIATNEVNAENNEVISRHAADALRAISFKQNSPVFLQNLNIPSLNLNGNLYLLSNGQKCFIAKKSGPCVIKTFFKVGSLNEPDELRGISHFIEHNLFNGSNNYPNANEFVEKVNSRGANYNASTDFAVTDYFIQTPLHKEDDLENFINLHADMLANPLFNEQMIEKEKGPVISEIQMLNDNPYSIVHNYLIKNLFGIKTNSQDLVGGSVENIKNLTREKVCDYYRTHYNPNNAITVVIGEVDENKTLELLNKNFADFKTDKNVKPALREKLTPIKSPVRADIVSPNTQSKIISLGFVGPKNNAADKLALNVLLYALAGYKNSRLVKGLENFDTDINANIQKISNAPDAPSAILFSTGTSKENQEDILKFIYSKIFEMSHVKIDAEELNLIKEKIKNNTRYLSESNHKLADLLGDAFSFENSFNSLTNFEKGLDTLTPDDIMSAAKKYLDLNKAAICVVNPLKQTEPSFGGNIYNTDKIDIKRYETINNAKIATMNIPDAKLSSVNIELKTDVPYNKPAILDILSRMLQKGTSLMSEQDFNNLEDKNNIISSLSNSYNSLKFNYSFPSSSVGTVLDNFHKNLYSPALTRENFEKAKKEIENFYMSMPKQATHRAVETMYEGTQKANISLRRINENLKDVTYEDVMNFYNNMIKSSYCQITLTGNLEDNDLLNKIYTTVSTNNKIYKKGDFYSEIQPKKTQKNSVIAEAQERSQADIVQMFRIKETGNVKDTAAIYLLNEILGGNSNSRLFTDLREKQKLAYRVNSMYSMDNNEGLLALRIFTTTDDKQNQNQSVNLQKAINGFKTHINKLIEQPVSDDELEAAKLQIKSSIILEMESTAGKNAILRTSMGTIYKEKYVEALLNAIDNTSKADLQKIASHYLTKPSVISIISSKDTINSNKEYLKSLGTLRVL